jgi:hypothetical protein
VRLSLPILGVVVLSPDACFHGTFCTNAFDVPVRFPRHINPSPSVQVWVDSLFAEYASVGMQNCDPHQWLASQGGALFHLPQQTTLIYGLSSRFFNHVFNASVACKGMFCASGTLSEFHLPQQSTRLLFVVTNFSIMHLMPARHLRL